MEPLSKFDAIIDVEAVCAHLCFLPPDYLPGGHWFGSGSGAMLTTPIYKDPQNIEEARQLQRWAWDL